jgi:hypothetical protein
LEKKATSSPRGWFLSILLCLYWFINRIQKGQIKGFLPGITGINHQLTGNKYINLFLLMAEEFNFAVKWNGNENIHL